MIGSDNNNGDEDDDGNNTWLLCCFRIIHIPITFMWIAARYQHDMTQNNKLSEIDWLNTDFDWNQMIRWSDRLTIHRNFKLFRLMKQKNKNKILNRSFWFPIYYTRRNTPNCGIAVNEWIQSIFWSAIRPSQLARNGLFIYIFLVRRIEILCSSCLCHRSTVFVFAIELIWVIIRALHTDHWPTYESINSKTNIMYNFARWLFWSVASNMNMRHAWSMSSFMFQRIENGRSYRPRTACCIYWLWNVVVYGFDGLIKWKWWMWWKPEQPGHVANRTGAISTAGAQNWTRINRIGFSFGRMIVLSTDFSLQQAPDTRGYSETH